MMLGAERDEVREHIPTAGARRDPMVNAQAISPTAADTALTITPLGLRP